MEGVSSVSIFNSEFSDMVKFLEEAFRFHGNMAGY